jgi:hypothetical protein
MNTSSHFVELFFTSCLINHSLMYDYFVILGRWNINHVVKLRAGWSLTAYIYYQGVDSHCAMVFLAVLSVDYFMIGHFVNSSDCLRKLSYCLVFNLMFFFYLWKSAVHHLEEVRMKALRLVCNTQAQLAIEGINKMLVIICFIILGSFCRWQISFILSHPSLNR